MSCDFYGQKDVLVKWSIIIISINERHSNIIVKINFKVAATAKAVGKVKMSHAAVQLFGRQCRL